MRCNWEHRENVDGRDRLVLERGQFPFGRDKMSNDLGMSVQTFRTICEEFIHLSELTIKPTNRGTIGTCVFYDAYINDQQETNQQTNQQVTSKSPATNHSKGSEDYKEESKPPLIPPITVAHATVSEAAPPPPKRVRKPRPETDPLTNPNLFLDRVEASGRETVIAWGKDSALVKGVLAGRLRAGVVDPQTEMWEMWERFAAGEANGAFTMRERAHDIPAFIQHYNLLMEKSSANGKTHTPTPPGSAPPPPKTHNSGAGVYDRTCPDCGQQVWRCSLHGCPAAQGV